ncbi:hypothetical protein HK098_004389 [Nowakowskiella sp. JEL0407]|nr:hypothetical protein HK098_004389 [Nowakowskiella sp. JEL0407]
MALNFQPNFFKLSKGYSALLNCRRNISNASVRLEPIYKNPKECRLLVPIQPFSNQSQTLNRTHANEAFCSLPVNLDAPLINVKDALELEFPDATVQFVPSLSSQSDPDIQSRPLIEWVRGDAILKVSSGGRDWRLAVDQTTLKHKMEDIDGKLKNEVGEFEKLDKLKNNLDYKAGVQVGLLRYGGMSLLAFQPLFVCWFTYELGWDIMGSLNIIAASFYFVLRNREFTYEDAEFGSKQYFTERLYRLRKFDLSEYEKLESDFKLKKDLMSVFQKMIA